MLVQCPACHEPFLALEEAPVVRKPGAPVAVRPPAPPAPRNRVRAEPVRDHTASQPADGPQFSTSSLPISVLIGFALLPLAIPLLWLIGPQVLGKPPGLTMAAPTALAVASSVLCLAVVLTVDWSPLTRIKGVLILVGLSYFAGLSLYFLKREVAERVREFFSLPDNFREHREGSFVVMAPEAVQALPKEAKPLPGWNLNGKECHSQVIAVPQVVYQFAAGPDRKLDDERWPKEVEQALLQAGGLGSKTTDEQDVKSIQGHAGRQWTIRLPDQSFRVVRVFRIGGLVYYLSVKLDELDDDLPLPVKRFFDSFRVEPPLAK